MIPSLYKINDSRISKQFTKKSFSGFSKTEVQAALQKSIVNGTLEESCTWTTELICSLAHKNVLDKFIIIASKLININNPKLPYLINLRHEIIIQLFKKYENDERQIRNDQTIRNYFCEICCILNQSKKNKALSLTKITANHFELENLKDRLRADKNDYIKHLYRPGDTNEVKLVLNEFYYELNNKKYHLCVYWLSWLVEWEKVVVKKAKKPYQCGYREIQNVDAKHYPDFIWFVWEILLKFSLHSDFHKYIISLYKLFKFEYAASKKSKRIPLVLNAIKYFTEFYAIESPVIFQYELLVQSCANVNILYYKNKKHEENDKSMMEYKLNELNSIVDKNNLPRKYHSDQNSENKKNGKKINISEKSMNKISIVDQIDSYLMNNK